MDLDLVGYLFALLDDDERQRTEAALQADPAARDRLDRLRAGLAPLAAARVDEPPPAGLADRTMERVAPYLHNHRPSPARPAVPSRDEPIFAPSRWRRLDVAVASCILIVVGGLGLAGAGKVQQRHDRFLCQDNMRKMHQALVSYSDEHDGRFPQVSDRPPHNVAGAFIPMLQDAGKLPAGAPPCPTLVRVATRTPEGGYAYTLGFRGPDGTLHGLSRAPGFDVDLMPILADRPAPAGHRTGHNVLFVGGNVRFCTTPKVGADGDDIFVNQADAIAAGLHRLDTVLADGNTPP